MSYIIAAPPNDHDVVLALEHLHGISELAGELAALLAGVEALPAELAADVVRVLGRIDVELTDLAAQIAEAGPG